MDYTEITLTLATGDLQTASDIAMMAVPYGFYVEDYSDLEQAALEIAHIDLIDELLVAKDRERAKIHIYIEPQDNPAEAVQYLRERLAAEQIAFELSTGEVCEADWANNWKQFFKPTEIGQRLLILPEWEPKPSTDRRLLKIDPGAAFGTGTHATTRLCLEALDGLVDDNAKLLDIGCGSGILSIAALLLGAQCADAVDIDALACKTAQQNAAKNGFAPPLYNVYQGDLTDKIHGRYSIVVANIVADAIISLSAAVPNFLLSDGVYITSGIIDTRADEVEHAICANGFTIQNKMQQGGWVCFVARIGG